MRKKPFMDERSSAAPLCALIHQREARLSLPMTASHWQDLALSQGFNLVSSVRVQTVLLELSSDGILALTAGATISFIVSDTTGSAHINTYFPGKLQGTVCTVRCK